MGSGPTILLAPTVHAMAGIQCLSSPCLPPRAQGEPLVHVFHAEYDGFCPEAQAQELADAGCEVHYCKDGHVLCNRSSVEEIARCLRQALASGNLGAGGGLL